MAIYKIEMNKRVEEHHWRNTYWYDTDTPATIATMVGLLTDLEVTIHTSRVYLVDASVNISPALGFPPTVFPINLFATRSSVSGVLKPENVLRVQFPTATYPGEKDYRWLLTEADVSGYYVDAALVTLVGTAWQTVFTDIPADTYLLTEGTSIITGYVVDQYVQNLQLHRKRKPVAA